MFYGETKYKERAYCNLKQLPSGIGCVFNCIRASKASQISSAESHFGLDAWHERSTVNKTA